MIPCARKYTQTHVYLPQPGYNSGSVYKAYIRSVREVSG